MEKKHGTIEINKKIYIEKLVMCANWHNLANGFKNNLRDIGTKAKSHFFGFLLFHSLIN